MAAEALYSQSDYSSVRRWPRFQVDVPLRVLTQRPRKIEAVEGRGTELNAGGMVISVELELSLHEQVAVEFLPPNSERAIRVRCFVRNRTGNSYGVEFITENDADYENVGELENHLRAIAKK